MIGSTNAGTGGGGTYSNSDFAFILVRYQSGATVTCTNGNPLDPVTLTDEESIGAVIFGVPTYGDWTVTVEDGEETFSQTVSILATEESTIKTVEASFGVNLVENGSPIVAFSVYSKGNVNQNGGYYVVTPGGTVTYSDYSIHNVPGAVYTSEAITVSNHSKITVNGEFSGKYLAIWNSDVTQYTQANAAATVELTASGTAELEIPSGLTEARIGFVGSGSKQIKVRNLYLS